MNATKKQEAYQDHAKAMLELWGAEIIQLRARTHLLEANTRIEATKRLEELERLYNEAYKQYGAMQENGGGKINDLKKKFDQIASRVRENLDELIREVA